MKGATRWTRGGLGRSDGSVAGGVRRSDDLIQRELAPCSGPGRRRGRAGRRSAALAWGDSRCRISHHRRLSSPPASALPEGMAPTVTTPSSAPLQTGAWATHQWTSRISRVGSASGSQTGQYERATAGLSRRYSVTCSWRGHLSPSVFHSSTITAEHPMEIVSRWPRGAPLGRVRLTGRETRRGASPPFRTSPRVAGRAAGRRGAEAPPSDASIQKLAAARPALEL